MKVRRRHQCQMMELVGLELLMGELFLGRHLLLTSILLIGVRVELLQFIMTRYLIERS
jgi:hydrogenase-4 membrane subunit HyfE